MFSTHKDGTSVSEPTETTHIENDNDAALKDHDTVTHEGIQDWTPEEEKALVKKIDRRIFPMLWIVFGLSLLDRGNVGIAYIAGMGKDLGLSQAARYSVVLLVFFPTYAIFELPSNYIIRRVGAQKWLSFLVVAWGLVVLFMGFVKSWKTLAVCRALLGVFEAGLFPGAIYIFGAWYRQFETSRRLSMFYAAALMSGAFGPLFAYGLSYISVGSAEFTRGWRWIFIVEGILTVVAGLLSPFFLADFPEHTKWLSPRERHIAVTRVTHDNVAKEFIHPTIKESLGMLLDWKLVIYSFQYFIITSSGYSLSFFAPLILRAGMGFDYTKSQLLLTPPYIFTIIAGLGLAWVSDKQQTRWPILIGQACVGIVGLVLTLYGHLLGVRYFGLFIAIFGITSNTPATLSYGQCNTADPRKKGVVAAAMITMGAAGGICGSTIFRSQDAPTYYPGMWTTIAMQVLFIIMTFTLSQHLKRENKLADEGKKPVLEGVIGFRYAP